MNLRPPFIQFRVQGLGGTIRENILKKILHNYYTLLMWSKNSVHRVEVRWLPAPSFVMSISDATWKQRRTSVPGMYG